MKYLRFAMIPAVLFLLPGWGQAGWFWQSGLEPGHSLSSVCFVGNNTGYSVGAGGIILKTTDGGVNWVSQISGTTNSLIPVSVLMDSLTGYVVGDNL